MSEIFGGLYADAYDALYRTKDYEGEADLIERLLAQNNLTGPRRLLDLGCGTGNHAIVLAKRGHDVVGVDQSLAMLAIAREKATDAWPPAQPIPRFEHGDLRHIEVDGHFDAIMMMFAVLCYLHHDDDILAALASVRRHMKPSGLFIFDVWNGNAVIADKPQQRSVSVATATARIMRETKPTLDLERHLCRVHFDVQRITATGERQDISEDHIIRYFFPEDLGSLLARSGLELISLRRFPDNERPADENAWNMIGVARTLP
jgi:SAM-dependent methyltransferase